MVIYAYRRAGQKQLSQKTCLDIILVLMLSGFIGGRLGHVLYEMPEFYFKNPLQIFYVWNGGFVFYGGFAVATVASVLFLKIQKISFYMWADFFAPVIALTYGLGRGACLLAGCCYGKSCSWGFDFGDGVLRHPTQAYALVTEVLIYLFLIFIEKRRKLPRGALFYSWLILHGAARVLMESYRDDFRGGFLLGISISSWFSYLLVLIAALGLITRFSKSVQSK